MHAQYQISGDDDGKRSFNIPRRNWWRWCAKDVEMRRRFVPADTICKVT